MACGPGLYCTSSTQTFANNAEHCVWPADDEDADPACGCHEVPASCEESDEDHWLCGQDGEVYASLCEANRARTDVVAYDSDAYCTLDDASFFRCGGIFCERGNEYCMIASAPDDHLLDWFSCVASPCASSGGCPCVLTEIDDRNGGFEPLTCIDSEIDAIVVRGVRY
jgi:hypothetical protein